MDVSLDFPQGKTCVWKNCYKYWNKMFTYARQYSALVKQANGEKGPLRRPFSCSSHLKLQNSET